MGQAEKGSWLGDWLELKEAIRRGTWENFERNLSEYQQEIVHLIGRFNAYYGIEEPDTKILYHGAWNLLQGRRTECSISLER